MPDERIKILVVQDNPGDARLLQETLSDAANDDYLLAFADRLDSALEYVARQACDLILLDLSLPDSAGIDTFDRIHAQVPAVPTIVFTGLDVEAVGTEAVKKGAQDYLIKGQGDTALLTRTIRYAIERKLLENQLLRSNRLESVGELAGGVAHEFNNLLTSIMGYTQLGITGLSLDDPVRQDLESVVRAAQRASKLASQLLTFSRHKVGEPKVFDINHLIMDSRKILQSVFEKDVELVVLFSPDLTCVFADPNEIDQVLLNLVMNARDAMPNGGKLVIETKRFDIDQSRSDRWGCQPGSYVSVVVEDNGVGMTEEVKTKLFDPFFTTKETGRGTGLGLSICFEIIKQSGGHIEVDSKIGQGTSIRMFFPCSTGKALTGPTDQLRDDTPIGNGTILLVEDEPMIRAMASRVLSSNGYYLLEAANGEEALRLAQTRHDELIDLLVTDVVMPRMGGIELAQCLAQARPHIRFLLMSGYSDEAPKFENSLTSPMPYLEKPFMPSELLRRVREVLED